MRWMSIGAAFRMVTTSVPLYFETMLQAAPRLFELGLYLMAPSIVLLLIGIMNPILPTGISILAKIILWLVGLMLAVLGPFLFMEILIDHRLGRDTNVKELLRNLGWNGAWNIMVVLSFVHIGAMIPFLALAIGFLVQMMLFSKVEPNPGILLLWFGALFLALFFTVFWNLVCCFTAQMQYFLRGISARPLKASMKLWRFRFTGIVLVYIVAMFISMGIGIAFLVPGFLEGMLLGMSDAFSAQGESDLMQMAQAFKDGTIQPQEMAKKVGSMMEAFRPGFTSTLSSIVQYVFTCSFFCFHVLYLMGFYHSEEWSFPEELQSK